MERFKSIDITNTVTVDKPTFVSEKVSGHVVYNVAGNDTQGAFTTQRRFKDFYRLREILLYRWTACYIPYLPAKLSVVRDIQGNKEDRFIEERRKALEFFMKKAINLGYVFETPEFQTFIRGPMAYREAVKHFVKPTFRYLQDHFMTFFGDYYKENETFEEYSSRGMEQDAKYRKVFNFLDKLEEHFRKVSNQLKAFKSDFRNMQIIHQEYEEQTLKRYQDQTRPSLILSYEPSLQNEEPFAELLDWIYTEKLEYNAILQAIQGRVSFIIKLEGLQQKLIELQKSKSSKMKSFFKKIKSIGDDDTYETEDSIKEGIDSAEKILNITCNRQAELDLPKFQAERLASFNSAIERFGSILHYESWKFLKVAEEIDNQLA